ncbi:MAG: pyridoxamine 5'-phosphate oxidase family protein [Aquincola sp.]|nr:pyridoxamine 5'-phosphate oxidase family protein [Aquincola sp.]MDH4288769.1 pyridoxamine 5'-phosphate oxidase family protein [Aquincola sp.]MDH5331524.1 pyridoxamine 5'-phosphate oxidase family protein [Aquincola sp.]
MNMAGRIESLQLIEAACWQELAEATSGPGHDWHHLVLATVAGRHAEARVVVLREVDIGARELIFFTDSRSPKVEQMRAHPEATLVAWSASRMWQLRLVVRCTVLTDGLEVSSRWARLKLSPSARDYLSPLPPGTPVDRYLPDRSSREHFAVVNAQVDSIDWLELHADGHRRARFDPQGARWLQP